MERPAPRLADGTISFMAAPGEAGNWNGLHEFFVSEDPMVGAGGFLPDLEEDVDRLAPFRPWARQLFIERQKNRGQDDPHVRYCVGNGGPRTFQTPWGLQFVHSPETEKIYILTGWSRRWKEIYMDGRSHPDMDTYEPTFFGHSIGHWEGDTLVIDTVGFNEQFWMARKPTGLPHTHALRVIERISRPNYYILNYEVTIDDPNAYTRPWTSASFEIRWDESEIAEYICDLNSGDTLLN